MFWISYYNLQIFCDKWRTDAPFEMARKVFSQGFELKSISIRVEQRGEENLLRQSEHKETLCAIPKRLEL